MTALPAWAIFLRERLDEDAVLATMRGWHAPECDCIPQVGSEYTYPCDCKVPERMMREVSAKRAILAAWLKITGTEPGDWPGDPAAADALLISLECILLVYEEHPAYATAQASLKESYWKP